MKRRTIRIASPIEPSGASWILNCLLELGVMVHHRPVERNVFRDEVGMWMPSGSGVRLHPRASILQKWMPALVPGKTMHFRDDVEVDYTQDLPNKGPSEGRAILFTRDPRDAIWSAFKRTAPEISFDEFLAFPHPRTLLDRASHWALFIESWLDRPDVVAFRFEDEKRDDIGTLKAALDHLELAYPGEEIARAAAASTFERAREAEARYRARHPGDREIANRAGQVGEVHGRPELATAASRIEASVGHLLGRLGYGAPTAVASPPAGFGIARLLGHDQAYALPRHLAAAIDRLDPLDDPRLPELLAFGRSLVAADFARHRTQTHEARAMLDALAALSSAHDARLRERLVAMRGAFVDGGAHHAQQIGALLRSRRGTARV